MPIATQRTKAEEIEHSILVNQPKRTIHFSNATANNEISVPGRVHKHEQSHTTTYLYNRFAHKLFSLDQDTFSSGHKNYFFGNDVAIFFQEAWCVLRGDRMDNHISVSDCIGHVGCGTDCFREHKILETLRVFAVFRDCCACLFAASPDGHEMACSLRANRETKMKC
jgi:hypothetical protein